MSCSQCGMAGVDAPKYHPYAACLMFLGCGNGDYVSHNLRAVVEYGMKAERAGVSIDAAMENIALVREEETKS